jgi:REP element-mobilizing transposase RayT
MTVIAYDAPVPRDDGALAYDAAVPRDDDALAYFIMFTCYGTWLHGDPRGSKHRRTRDEVVELPLNPIRAASAAGRMKSDSIALDRARRGAVDASIRETCEFHGWYVWALNVRSNHVHLVLSADAAPARVVNTVKSRATLMLRQSGLVGAGESVWSRGASKRYPWSEDDVADCATTCFMGRVPTCFETGPLGSAGRGHR